MANAKYGKLYIAAGGAGIVGIIVVAFLLVGPPKLLAKSDSPGFCAGCHVMEYEHRSWMHAGAHRRNRCVDCHLPNHNLAVHYVWKSIDGMKDAIMFYSGKVPDPILLSDHGKKVLQQNCIRCHEETVAMIDTSRDCWECHRSITHKRSGAIETL